MSFSLFSKQEKLGAIARRRQELVERAAGQREHLRDLQKQLERPLLWVDWGFSVVRLVRDNPILVSLGTAALVKFMTRRGKNDADQPRSGLFRRILRIPGHLFRVWGIFRQVRRALSLGLL